jgi:murein L,D-transpeptidase YcbB/YkuD
MKKTITTTLALGAIFLTNSAFALTNQIESAEKFINKNKGASAFKNFLNNPDILIDNRDNAVQAPIEAEEEAIDTYSDIYKGKKHKAIKSLKTQLGWEVDDVYDQKLFEYVKKVQKEKGLNPTGIIDRTTWFSLYNQPLSWKIKTVDTALANWNNIVTKNQSNKSDKMILVNIPSMKLYLYQKKASGGYNLLLESPVVIGRIKTQTPLNDFEIISLKYNPNWTPTRNMLKKHLYKNGELNVKWLEDHDLSLIDETGELREYDELSMIEKPRFVQASGDKNALGNLKLETSSKEDIYLHDTNERHLFNFNTRTYSSGCIRVKEYVSLAALVSGKTNEYVQKNIDKKDMFFERIPQRVPVYFDYSQVSFSGTDSVQFYSDIYSKNKNK